MRAVHSIYRAQIAPKKEWQKRKKNVKRKRTTRHALPNDICMHRIHWIFLCECKLRVMISSMRCASLPVSTAFSWVNLFIRISSTPKPSQNLNYYRYCIKKCVYFVKFDYSLSFHRDLTFDHDYSFYFSLCFFSFSLYPSTYIHT